MKAMLRLALVGLPLAATFESACDCSCCEATVRPPSMMESGASLLMCSPISSLVESGSSSCTDRCIDSARADQRVEDYSRYCYKSCHAPTMAGKSCSLVQEAAEVQLVRTEDAPAKAPESPEVTAARGAFAEALANEAELAKSANASATARKVANLMLRAAKKKSTMVEQAQDMILDGAHRAELYSQSAAATMEVIKKELEELKAAPQAAAKEATQAVIAELNRQAAESLAVVAQVEAKVAKPADAPATKLSAAATEAAAPYVAAQKQAEAQAEQFKARSDSKRDEAKKWMKAAHVASLSLKTLELDGTQDQISSAQKHVRTLLTRAKEAETEADKADDTAHSISLKLPSYAEAAKAAVAKADADAAENWMPPRPSMIQLHKA